MAQANTVQAHRDAANVAFEKAQSEFREGSVRDVTYFNANMQIAQFHATMALSAKD